MRFEKRFILISRQDFDTRLYELSQSLKMMIRLGFSTISTSLNNDML